MSWSRLVLAGALAAVVLGSISPARATPITIDDPGGYVPNPGGASNNGDVVGELRLFDIEKIVFTTLSPGNITADIYFNYNIGDISLSQFSVGGLNLNVGDLLFDVNGTYKYGVVLKGHDSLTTGSLYKVASTSDFYTAFELINPQGAPSLSSYRPNELVQIQTPDGDAIGTGSVSTVLNGSPEVKTTVSFTPSVGFWNDLAANGMSVHFAAATCANDIADGSIPPVPEPATLLLLGTGLAGAGIGALRRRSGRKA